MDRRNFSISMMAKEIREALVNCWERANPQFRPPIIITNKSIERKIQVAWTALENFAWKRGGMKKEEDRVTFKEKLDMLFNIASCSHTIVPCAEAGCEGCQRRHMYRTVTVGVTRGYQSWSWLS